MHRHIRSDGAFRSCLADRDFQLRCKLQGHVQALGLSALFNQLSQVYTAFHAALQVIKKGGAVVR